MDGHLVSSWTKSLQWFKCFLKNDFLKNYLPGHLLTGQSLSLHCEILSLVLNPEMICYLSKRQQMILSAKTLYSISLFRPSSSPGDRFTVLHGFTEWKHCCYYLHLLSSHLLLEKKMVCSQTEGKQIYMLYQSFCLPIWWDLWGQKAVVETALGKKIED